MKNMMFAGVVAAILTVAGLAQAQTPMGNPVEFGRAQGCATAIWVHRTPFGDAGVAVGEVALNERTYYTARQRVTLDTNPRYAGACDDVTDPVVWRAMCDNGWLVGRFCDREQPRPTFPDAGVQPSVLPSPPPEPRVVYVDRWHERTVYRDRPRTRTTTTTQPPPAPPAPSPPPVPAPHADITPAGQPVRPPLAPRGSGHRT